MTPEQIKETIKTIKEEALNNIAFKNELVNLIHVLTNEQEGSYKESRLELNLNLDDIKEDEFKQAGSDFIKFIFDSGWNKKLYNNKGYSDCKTIYIDGDKRTIYDKTAKVLVKVNDTCYKFGLHHKYLLDDKCQIFYKEIKDKVDKADGDDAYKFSSVNTQIAVTHYLTRVFEGDRLVYFAHAKHYLAYCNNEEIKSMKRIGFGTLDEIELYIQQYSSYFRNFKIASFIND